MTPEELHRAKRVVRAATRDVCAEMRLNRASEIYIRAQGADTRVQVFWNSYTSITLTLPVSLDQLPTLSPLRNAIALALTARLFPDSLTFDMETL